MPWYLARSILLTRISSLFKLSPWGHKWPHPKGTYFYIAKTFKNHLLMDYWPKIVSVIERDPQALLTIRTYIVKKRCIKWASRPVGLLYIHVGLYIANVNFLWTYFSPKPLNWFHPNLVGSICRECWFRFAKIKGLVPIGPQ